MKRSAWGLIFLLIVNISVAQSVDRLLFEGEYEQVCELLEKKHKQGNITADELFILGKSYQQLFLHQQAITCFEQLLVKKFDRQVAMGCASSCAALNRNLKAIALYEKLWGRENENSVVGGKLAQLYMAEKQFDQALAVYEPVYLRDTTNLYFKKQYAKAAYAAKKEKIAIALYEKILEEYFDDLSAIMQLSIIYTKKGRIPESILCLERGLACYPDNKRLKHKLAHNRFLDKRYAGAYELYDQLRADGDSTLLVMKYLGICCYFQEKYKKGVEILKHCYSQAANDPFISFYLGLCLKGVHDYDESLKLLNISIKNTIPGYLADIYHHKAVVHGLQRDFQESITCYEKVYELDSAKVDVLYQIATTYEELTKNGEAALKYYREFLLKNAGKEGKKIDYALDRVRIIRENLFFEQKPE